MTSDEPSCKYTARLERVDGRYVVEVPTREIELGALSPGDVCQVTVDLLEEGSPEDVVTESESTDQSDQPVTVGERLTVEIDDVGQQGDGIARVGEGYVLIVPGSDMGEEVDVEVQHTNPTYGFAELLEADDEDDEAGASTAEKPAADDAAATDVDVPDAS